MIKLLKIVQLFHCDEFAYWEHNCVDCVTFRVRGIVTVNLHLQIIIQRGFKYLHEWAFLIVLYCFVYLYFGQIYPLLQDSESYLVAISTERVQPKIWVHGIPLTERYILREDYLTPFHKRPTILSGHPMDYMSTGIYSLL